MTPLNQLTNFNSRFPSREKREEKFKKDYDIELLTNVINYNKQKYLSFKTGQSFEINKEYEKILSARYQKVGRIRRRLVYLLSNFKYVWFCTFTFSDKYINKCERTKRDLIKNVISSHDFKYILNIDYGHQNHRQHFHCIISTNLDFDVNQYFQSFYTGGYSFSKLCDYGINDLKKLTKYVDKLTNHCIKATTNRQRIVYNFKGYELLYPTPHEQRIAYFLDYFRLYDVSLLDKADITGKIN